MIDKNKKEKSPSELDIKNMLKYFKIGKYDEAKKLATSIVNFFPNHIPSLKILGIIFNAQGKFTRALEVNKRVVILAPEDPVAYNNIGISFRALGEFENAKDSYKKAIEIKNDFFQAYNNLGNTYSELGELDKAKKNYVLSTKYNSEFVEGFINLAKTLKKQKKYEEAKKNLLKALDLTPNNFDALFNLGDINYILNNLNEAEINLRQLIKLNPNSIDVIEKLGVVLQKLGNNDEAETLYKEIIKLDPNRKSKIISKGLHLYSKRKFREAINFFDQYGNSQSNLRALESLYELGDLNEIYNRIEKLSSSDPNDINVASFASYLFCVTNKKTTNKFCNNPMDYIYFSNISSQLDKPDEYVSELLGDIYSLKKSWEPSNQTVKNGHKTLGNLFKENKSNILLLKKLIMNEIQNYYSKFKNRKCLFIENWPKSYDLKGWSIIQKENGNHLWHIHQSGWLSGVIYLKVVPPLGSNEGAIEFSSIGPYKDNKKTDNLYHNPNVGDVVFFPSSLYHRTIPYSSDAERITVSFDLKPN